MRGICPECKLDHPIDKDDRMMDHKDQFGYASCLGVGQDCGSIVKEKSRSPKSSKIRSKENDLPFVNDYDALEKEILQDPRARAAYEKNKAAREKGGFFGSLLNFDLAQKERKAKK